MNDRLLVLELNDLGVTALRGDLPGPLPCDGSPAGSPGFALDRAGLLVCGRQAEEACRLDPVRSRNTFWDRLGTEALPQPFAGCRSHAEIAFAHLRHIMGQTNPERLPVLLLLPPHATREQAGLLSSMLRELGVAVRAFLPSPLAAADFSSGSPVLLVDLFLHRATATLYAEDGTQRIAGAASAGAGATEWLRSWTAAAAREFLRLNRFDPLHQASSEQQLHDQLRAVLGGAPAELILEHSGRRMPVRLDPDRLAEASRSCLDEVAMLVSMVRADSPAPPVLQLAPRAGAIPGLSDHLARHTGMQPVRRPANASLEGALAALNAGRIPPGDNLWLSVFPSPRQPTPG